MGDDVFHESEEEDLKVHVVSCALRYKALRGRIHRVELAIYVLIGLVLANTDLALFKGIIGAFKP